MKQRILIIFTLLFALAILPNVTFSQQEVIIVPDEYDSGEGSSALGVLNRFIMNDTISGGERAHPNCIYRLTRGKYYQIDSRLYIDCDFTLDALPDDPASSTRPPIVYVGKNIEGDHEDMMFQFQGDSTDITLKNIIFQGAYADQAISTESQYMAFMYGAFHRYEMDNCITHGFTASVLSTRASDRCSFFVTNNIHYNNFELQGVGGGGYASNTMKYSYNDSVVYINNTFFIIF